MGQFLTSRELMTVGDGRYRLDRCLYLRVRNQGRSRNYIFRYTVRGKTSDISIGSPREMPISKARSIANAYRQKISNEKVTFPQQLEQNCKAPLLKDIYEQALEYMFSLRKITNPTSIRNAKGAVKKHVVPKLGNYAISEVTTSMVVDLLAPFESRSSRGRIKSYVGYIFKYALKEGWIQEDPSTKQKLDVWLVKTPNKDKNHFKTVSVDRLKEIMEMLFQYKQSRTAMSLIFGCFVVLRSHEYNFATMEEVDFENMTWTVPPERRKDKKAVPFVVPVSRQLNTFIRFLGVEEGPIFQREYREGRYVSGAITYLKRRGVYDFSPHSIRSCFSTWCAETGKDPVLREMCLMHATDNKVAQAYQRSDLLERRRVLLQEWADVLISEERLMKLLAS